MKKKYIFTLFLTICFSIVSFGQEGDNTSVYKKETVSIKKNSIEGFATYPNPITNKNFTITTSKSDKKEVVIFNVLGKKVFSSSFTGTKKNLDVSDINAGIYILKVTENNTTVTKKLVIK